MNGWQEEITIMGRDLPWSKDLRIKCRMDSRTLLTYEWASFWVYMWRVTTWILSPLQRYALKRLEKGISVASKSGLTLTITREMRWQLPFILPASGVKIKQ